jgi:hypothetical protein
MHIDTHLAQVEAPGAVAMTAREQALWRFAARYAPFVGSVTFIIGLILMVFVLAAGY